MSGAHKSDSAIYRLFARKAAVADQIICVGQCLAEGESGLYRIKRPRKDGADQLDSGARLGAGRMGYLQTVAMMSGDSVKAIVQAVKR